MTIDLLKRVLVFFVFVLAQVLVLGRIHLFHYATPLLYIYFITMFPRNYPKWALLLWAFAMGLSIDVFTNTPGLAAASLTLIAAIQPYLLEAFLSRDSAEDFKPSLMAMGPSKYSVFIITLVSVYCIVFYSLEIFNFLHFTQWIFSVVGSAVLTLLFIYVFEVLKGNQ